VSPSFSDGRARQLLEQARQAGLKPRSDAELLPLLLDLLGGVTPVPQWPTQASPTRTDRRHRTEHAREATRAAAATADRPPASTASGPAGGKEPATVVPLRPAQHATQVQTAVDAERRRRREAAVPHRPQPPPRLGDAFRRRSLFLLPADDEPDEAGPERAG
jgi:hypothetical protein